MHSTQTGLLVVCKECSAPTCGTCCTQKGKPKQRTLARDFRQPREDVWDDTIERRKHQQGSFDPAELGNEGATPLACTLAVACAQQQ